MKYLIILMIIILQGCATTQLKEAQNLSEIQGMTQSLCIKGVLVSMRMSQCTKIEEELVNPQMLILSCAAHSKERQNTIWLLNDFFIMPQETIIPEGITLLCSDPTTIIGTTEKD